MILLRSIPLLLLMGASAIADTITSSGTAYNSTQMVSPTTTWATNSSIFTYYGFPTTNYPASMPNGQSTVGIGISSTNSLWFLLPMSISFSFTGTNLELIGNSSFYLTNGVTQTIYYSINDGAGTTSYTNSSDGGSNGVFPRYTEITFGSNILHNIILTYKGGFVGINTTNGNTLSSHVLTSPKPNLLIVEGDSYLQGYNPTIPNHGYNWSWFDGWAQQLVASVPNTIVIPSAVSGTGFLATNGGNGDLPYYTRVTNDICVVYSNAAASGKYNNIFVAISGTINDWSNIGLNAGLTNALLMDVTNTLNAVTAACSGSAGIWMIGNWLGTGGETAPGTADFQTEWAMTNGAKIAGVTIYDPIPANLKNVGNYNTFYPTGSTTDSVHPSAAGYAIYAQWLETNLANTYGASWTNNTGATFYNSVTNYGAIGDAHWITVNTTSNSATVTASSPLLAGEVIEIWQGGMGTTYPSHQDMITTVTSGGTTATLAIPVSNTMTGQIAFTGTNNNQAFQSAVDAVATTTGYLTNIYVPTGNFLLVSTQALAATAPNSGSYPAVYLTKGGINFLGEGGTNCVLTTAGAWHRGADGACFRSEMFASFGPVSNSGTPVIFSGLWFDGGSTNGNKANSQPPASTTDGTGWDTTHHAISDHGTGQNQVLMLVTNCIFNQLMGENTITFTGNGGVGCFKDIENCTFENGSGSAINFYYGQHIHGCTFSYLNKVEEYYQANTTLPVLFDRNTATNITGNAFSINGAIIGNTNYPVVISNNVMSVGNGLSIVTLGPAQNVTIVTNSFYGGTSDGVSLITAGQQGNGICSNIVVSLNNFHSTQVPVYIQGMTTATLIISNNTGGQVSNPFLQVAGTVPGSGATLSNCVLANNISVGYLDTYCVATNGQFAFDTTNNSFGYNPYFDGDYGAGSTALSYGHGRNHTLTTAAAFFLDTTNAQMIWPNAQMTITNHTSAMGNITFYTSPSLAQSVTLAYTGTTNVYWNPVALAWGFSPYVPSLPVGTIFNGILSKGILY